MNKKSIIKYGIIVAIASIAIIYTPLIYTITLSIMQVEPTYIEPISMRVDKLEVKKNQGFVSGIAGDIVNMKDKVVYSIRGEVIDIRKPLLLIEEGSVDDIWFIPIDIRIKDVYKGDLKKGDIFTIYIQSSNFNTTRYANNVDYVIDEYKWDENIYIESYEPTYNIGEEVMVHIAIADLEYIVRDLEYVDEDLPNQLPYSILGKYGKYTIKDGLAYNEKYPYGVPIPYIAYEVLP